LPVTRHIFDSSVFVASKGCLEAAMGNSVRLDASRRVVWDIELGRGAVVSWLYCAGCLCPRPWFAEAAYRRATVCRSHGFTRRPEPRSARPKACLVEPGPGRHLIGARAPGAWSSHGKCALAASVKSVCIHSAGAWGRKGTRWSPLMMRAGLCRGGAAGAVGARSSGFAAWAATQRWVHTRFGCRATGITAPVGPPLATDRAVSHTL